MMLDIDYEDLEEAERSSKRTDSRPPLSVNEWRYRDLPEPDFLMGEWITTTSRILQVAPTGIGKTNLIISLGMAIAAGIDFLHWRGRRVSNVLYVDGEMSRRLLKQRILEAAMRLGAEPEGFHALSHEEFSNFQPLNTKEGQDQIEFIIAQIAEVDLVIFDSVMCLTIGDMKEEGPWNQIMPWVRSLTQRRIGQVWVNHTGHDETRQYGTKTREWQMDTLLFQRPVKRDETDICFDLDFRKARERTPANRADFRPVRVSLLSDVWKYEEIDSMPSSPSPTALKFLHALNNVLIGSTRVVSGRPAADTEIWKNECVRLGLIDKASKPDSARALFSKYRRELVVTARVACDGEWSWAL